MRKGLYGSFNTVDEMWVDLENKLEEED